MSVDSSWTAPQVHMYINIICICSGSYVLVYSCRRPALERREMFWCLDLRTGSPHSTMPSRTKRTWSVQLWHVCVCARVCCWEHVCASFYCTTLRSMECHLYVHTHTYTPIYIPHQMCVHTCLSLNYEVQAHYIFIPLSPLPPSISLCISLPPSLSLPLSL